MKRFYQVMIMLVCFSLLLSGCTALTSAGGSSAKEASSASSGVASSPEAEIPSEEAMVFPEPTATPEPILYESGAGKVRISEVMSKNKATLRDADGAFPDWVELENICGTAVSLEGWALAKNGGEDIWVFPPFTLYEDSRAIVFCSKKDRADTELHTNFSIGKADTLTLHDRNGDVISTCRIAEDQSDYSLIPDENGDFRLSPDPTPGYENTPQGYEFFMASRAAAGPLVINEVCVDNYSDYYNKHTGYSDWVEIKNISTEAVDLSSYCLSDDSSDLSVYRLDGMLSPGELKVILCDKDYSLYTDAMPIAPFSLNSENERLFLSSTSGEIIDFVFLHEIPYCGSFGRSTGGSGFFYFTETTPGRENSTGVRRVSALPRASEPDGVFEGVSSVTVTLEAAGDIYYPLDCSVPTAASAKYTGPLTISSTTVLRAISIEEGALPSRVRTLNYILNEGHTLPVACVVADNMFTFNNMYYNGYKGIEVPGNLAFYEDDGSFSLPCGIKMYGTSSLVLPKKNLSLRFRGSYGAEELSYDLFDGGVANFESLILRAGQDQNNCIVKNEACYSLASDFSDNVVIERFKYCIVYLNGQYNGIYNIMEKPNEAMYASMIGKSKDSVEMLEATVYQDTSFYQDVITYIYSNDMRDPEAYDHIASLVDMNSLADWTILQGFFGNYDLASGNLRYVRDLEGGKWKCVLFDMDVAFVHPCYIFYNVFSYDNQISTINIQLVQNEAYRTLLLQRASEAYHSVLTVENTIAKFDELCAVVEPEVSRDTTKSMMSYDSWRNHVHELEELISSSYWMETNVDVLCHFCNATEAERQLYFGDLFS